MYQYHYVWYLLGFLFAPRITMAVVLSLYAKSLNIPLFLMIIIWAIAILPVKIDTKK